MKMTNKRMGKDRLCAIIMLLIGELAAMTNPKGAKAYCEVILELSPEDMNYISEHGGPYIDAWADRLGEKDD